MNEQRHQNYLLLDGVVTQLVWIHNANRIEQLFNVAHNVNGNAALTVMQVRRFLQANAVLSANRAARFRYVLVALTRAGKTIELHLKRKVLYCVAFYHHGSMILAYFSSKFGVTIFKCKFKSPM